MPKLILLVACEKVIIDRAELPSIISIFQAMKFQLQDAPLPENAVSPQRWSIFSMWKHTPEEEGVEFVQHTEILRPNGEVFGTPTVVTFKVTGGTSQTKNQVDVIGLPVGEAGTVKIRIWLDGVPDSAAEYEFRIEHLPREINAENSVTTSISIQ